MRAVAQGWALPTHTTYTVNLMSVAKMGVDF